MSLDRRLAQRIELLLGEARGHEVLGRISRIARGVVVTAPIRRDLNRRKGHGPVLQIDHRNSDVAPLDELLDHDVFAVGEGVDHGRAQLSRIGDGRQAEGGTAVRRLDDDGEDGLRLDGIEHRSGSELTEEHLGERRPPRSRQARGSDEGLRGRLVRGELGLNRAGTDEGDVEGLQEGLEGAVLADRTVDERPDHIGGEGLDSGGELLVEVREADFVAGLGKGVGHPTTRTDGDVALVGETAGDDEDLRFHGFLLVPSAG